MKQDIQVNYHEESRQDQLKCDVTKIMSQSDSQQQHAPNQRNVSVNNEKLNIYTPLVMSPKFKQFIFRDSTCGKREAGKQGGGETGRRRPETREPNRFATWKAVISGKMDLASLT